MTRLLLACVFAVVLGYGTVKAQEDMVPKAVTPECLKCLCAGASGCKTDVGCDNGVCGPFQITRPYWQDAGKPVVKGDKRGSKSPTAYADCANNMECSGQAVTAYMKRYAKDCNEDGEIDCADYASIHRLGPGSCKSPLDQTFYYKFAECYHRAAQQSASNNIGPRNEVLARSSIPV